MISYNGRSVGVSVEEAGVIGTRNAVIIAIGSVLWFYIVYKLFH